MTTMTTLRPAFAATGLALLALPIHGATIYSETFTTGGATALNASSPDVTTGGNTWTASEWLQNGTITASGTGTTNDDGAYLAFTPTIGKIYTLSATMTAPTGGATNGWIGLGFAASNGNNNISLTANNASPWMLWRPNPAASGQTANDVVSFTGAGAVGSASEGVFTGTQTLTIVLDTMVDLAWKAEWFVGSSSVRTHTFTDVNPVINYVGLARENGQTSTISNFSLTVVPEPSAALLGGLGLLALLRRRR